MIKEIKRIYSKKHDCDLNRIIEYINPKSQLYDFNLAAECCTIKCYEDVLQKFRKNGHTITEEEITDCFVDAIYDFRENIIKGKFEKEDEAFCAYLYMISHRKFLNNLRKKKKEKSSIEPYQEKLKVNEKEDKRKLNEEEEKMIQIINKSCYEQIKGRKREIFILHYEEGLTFKEIAKYLTEKEKRKTPYNGTGDIQMPYKRALKEFGKCAENKYKEYYGK